MALNSKTQSYIQQIKSKMKNSLTGGKQFANNDQVIDYAVAELYDQLKQRRLV